MRCTEPARCPAVCELSVVTRSQSNFFPGGQKMRPMLLAAVAGLIIVLGGNAIAFNAVLPHSSALRSMRCGTQGFEASAL